MNGQPSVESRVAALETQVANLNALLAASKFNDLNWAVMQLLEIGRITGLPAEMHLDKLVDWVRAHWKP